MAVNRQTVVRFLNKLDDLQKQIEELHQELLLELDEEELSEEEIAEIKAIQKENDYRTLEEWEKESSI